MRTLPVFILLALLGLAAAPLAPARAGPDDLERMVDAECKAQDTQVEKALAAKRPVDPVVAIYARRSRQDGSPLSEFLYARLLAKTGKFDLALRHFQQALTLKPDFDRAEWSLAFVLFGRQQPEKSLAHVESILRRNPDYGRAVLLKLHLLHVMRRWSDLKAYAEALLRKDSTDVQARRHLAYAYMGLGDFQRAKTLAQDLVDAAPQEIGFRILWVDCCLGLKQYQAAEDQLRRLHKAFPKDLGIRQKLASVRLEMGDAAGAVPLLRGIVQEHPEQPGVRVVLVQALLMLKDFAAAKKELEALRQLAAQHPDAKDVNAWVLRMQAAVHRELGEHEDVVKCLKALDALEPLPPNLLDMLQASLAALGRHAERVPYLERLRPALKGKPKALASLDTLLAQIRAGTAPEPGTDAGIFSERDLEALVQRAQSADPAVRRKALHEYYEREIPFVDPAVYHRYDPNIEHDPECRVWVVKILGRFERSASDTEFVHIASFCVARALEDTDITVRQAAAEATGHIGVPEGLVYLRPYLMDMPLDPSRQPRGEEDRHALEREYNAARGALRRLTGHQDLPPGAPDWVDLEHAAANRQAWLDWMDSPEGVQKLLQGVQALGTYEKVDPRWPLRYLLILVTETKPKAVPAAVALMSYRVLHDRIAALPDAKRAADPWWKDFPLWGADRVDAQHLPALRTALLDWFEAVRGRGRGG
jgi:tetratricopeptide (TPR) repeat protein